MIKIIVLKTVRNRYVKSQIHVYTNHKDKLIKSGTLNKKKSTTFFIQTNKK